MHKRKKPEFRLGFFFLFLGLASGVAPANRVTTFPQLVHPFRFYVYGGHIYITEKASIYIHSARDFRLLKKFGKPGQGPGEFPTDGGEVLFDVRPDHVIVRCITRLTYFSKEGEFIKEIKVPPTAGRYLSPIGAFFVGRKYSMDLGNVRYHGIYLYDSDFRRVREIYKHKHGFQGINTPFNPIAIDEADFENCDDRIFVCDAARTELQAFDIIGKKLSAIVNRDELVRFTEKDKEELIREYKADAFWSRAWATRRHLFQFPEYFPPIRWFHIDPRQKIVYIETHQEEKDNRKWLLFDFDGKLQKSIMLPVRGMHAFYNGVHYRLAENEEKQEWELYATPVR